MTNGITDLGDLNPTRFAGAIAFQWECPRCGALNTSTITTQDLIYDGEVVCSNPRCARQGTGDALCQFAIDLKVHGWYKDENDVPLPPKQDYADPVVRSVLVVVSRRKRTTPSVVAKELGMTANKAGKIMRRLVATGALRVVGEVFYEATVPYVET